MGNGLKRWLGRLKEGDQSAFRPLYERTAPGMLRFLLWKTNGDKALAEDILQETYVRFLLNLDRIESEEEIAIQTYLLRIAKNCLIDKAARTPRATHPHVSDEVLGNVADPYQSARQERAVELRELSVAMSSLNERESEIIWLRDALGLSHREVAQEIGMTEEASRQAYVRAKRNLLSELGDRVSLEKTAYAVSEMP